MIRDPHANSVSKDAKFLPSTSVDKRIWLNGNAITGGKTGWNGTSPGPYITVTSGQTVLLLLNSTDIDHNWFIDINNDFHIGEISSPVFSISTSPLSFIFRPVIDQNIPKAGNYTYRCMYHLNVMYGTIRVVQLPPVPDFSITVRNKSLRIDAGGSNTTNLEIRSVNSFSGSVSLSSSSSPVGPIIAFARNPVPLSLGSTNTSTVQIISPSQVPANSYNITLTGTSGSLTHSVTLIVVVQDFSISVSPSTVAVNAGVSGSSNVTVTSINNFTSNVDLSTSVSPSSGLTCRLTPNRVTPLTGGTAVSTLTCSGSANTYTVTLTGTSGSLSHGIILKVDVIAFSPSPTPASSPNSAKPGFPILTLEVTAGIIAGISVAGLFAVRGKWYRRKG